MRIHRGLAPASRVLLATAFLSAFVPNDVEAGQPPSKGQVQELRRRIEGLLEEELTRHWYPQAIDKTLGGFHQNFDRDWSASPDENRFLVYQARMTWTAAAFASHSERRRQEYLEYARYGVEYLDTVMRDRQGGGFHWVLDPRGRVDQKLGDEKHVYGTAFVLYAASEAYEVSRDERALRVARDAFDWLEKHARDPEHGGYFEALTREGTPILQWEARPPGSGRTDRLGVYHGFKSMNSHIHLLEAIAEFSKVEPRELVKERLGEVLALVRDRIAVEPGALNLYLTRDWRATPAHDSFGHDVETAYLLVEAAEALGTPDDPKTWRMARMLVDHALDWGWDDEFGGFYDKGDVFAGRAYDTTKVWWTQAEGLNTLLLFHSKYGDQTNRYWEAFLRQWDFIENHQIDSQRGGWYGEVTREGRLIGDGRKATQWKANYHTARALMNVARMLGDLENRLKENPR
ncbi:MAG: AGE family epimerase/isomerase [Isosphaeraceae bacterium]